MINLSDISSVYFIGIGGIGMSALARYLRAQGKQVAGYDKMSTTLTDNLVKEGIEVNDRTQLREVDAAFLDPGKTLVVYTPAVQKDFSLLVAFRESGHTLIKRAALLGQISKSMTCLAVAGTHGKTTTSAMLSHLLYHAGVSFTAFCGGIIGGYYTNYLHTGNEFMVVEADEFDRSFMHLDVDVMCITTMDADHLDIYGDEATFAQTFHDFAQKVSPEHRFVTEHVGVEGQQLGIDGGAIRLSPKGITEGMQHFDLFYQGEQLTGFALPMPGKHNLLNAGLALCLALQTGVSPQKLREGLRVFPGVDRRFSVRIQQKDLVVIDDYAHHPTEIDAVYTAVKSMYPDQPTTVVFQPHLYSRTRDFMKAFAQSLACFDQVFLLPIYPARESAIPGITSEVLAMHLHKINPDVGAKVVSKADLSNAFLPKGVVALLGAGDIGVTIKELVAIWEN